MKQLNIYLCNQRWKEVIDMAKDKVLTVQREDRLPITQKEETKEVFEKFLELLNEEQQKEFQNFLNTAKALLSMKLLKPVHKE